MSEEIIDRGALQRLLDVIGGDPEDLQELIEEFENTTPGLLRSMQDAAASGDQRALCIAAYSLKANGPDFGATRLADLCGALEADCRDGTAADPIGRLAAIFRGMAAEIYERELKLRRAIQTLKGSFLVLAAGLIWGLTPALSRMASGPGSNPLGLAVWVNLISAIFCLSIAAYRRKPPRLGRREILFFLYWAVLAGILQRMTTFVVTEHVEAAMLSLIVTLQGFMVFAFAAITKMEKTSPRRLIGLFVGLLGVSLVRLTRFDMSNGARNAWLLFAMLLPLLFAVEALVLAGKRPEHIDIFASVGLMMALSTLLLVPLAYARGDLMPLGPRIGRLEVLVVLMGIVGAGSLLLAFHLISTAGAVFYSQGAYAMTIAGVVWGMLLLNEELSSLAWVAFAVIVVGMYVVEPKSRDEELVIRRSFKD